jgi:hypothetical protein
MPRSALEPGANLYSLELGNQDAGVLDQPLRKRHKVGHADSYLVIQDK